MPGNNPAHKLIPPVPARATVTDADGKFTPEIVNFLRQLADLSLLIRNLVETWTKTLATAPTTNSTSWVMAGLNIPITTQNATVLNVMMNGIFGNGLPGGSGITELQIVSGSGNPPGAGAAIPSGATLQGMPVSSSLAYGGWSPFALTAQVTGIIPGNPYWVDLAIMCYSTGSGAITNVQNINVLINGYPKVG